MKRTLYLTITAVLTTAICLFGCSSTVNLDKHASLRDMSYGISSEWEQVYVDDEDDSYGADWYMTQNYINFEFMYSSLYVDASLTEVVERQLDYLKENSGSSITNIKYETLGTTTVDEHECIVFEYSYHFSDDGEYDVEGIVAYIKGSSSNDYEVTIIGEANAMDYTSVLDAILATISFTS